MSNNLLITIKNELVMGVKNPIKKYQNLVLDNVPDDQVVNLSRFPFVDLEIKRMSFIDTKNACVHTFTVLLRNLTGHLY